MKRLFLFFLVSISVCISSLAQKKELAQAKTYLKSGKDFDKAETLMRKLLADSNNVRNIKVWNMLADAVRMQYEQGNEKLYLKQKSDTAALFLTCQRMFLVYEGMDSVDAMPDDKGRVKQKYRKRNSEYLDGLRRNLYNGGVYFVSKQNYGSAYSILDTYLECVKQPLFSSYKYDYTTKQALSAAYLATYCGAKLADNGKTLKYSDIALQYKSGREKTLQFLANIYNERKEYDRYCDVLRTGFHEYPKSEYFFTRLVDYYNNANMADSSLLVVNQALEVEPTNILFLYGKSNILLNTGKYKDCVAICDSIISIKDSIPDVYYNAGVAYLNLAFEAEKTGGKKGKAMGRKYYSLAKPYMEKYRALAPDHKDKWAAGLYNIYLNLNMGKEFEEITKILEK